MTPAELAEAAATLRAVVESCETAEDLATEPDQLTYLLGAADALNAAASAVSQPTQ